MPTEPLKFGDCENCKLYADGRGPISYRGPLDAPVVVIGQSPGNDEILTGTPFVGASGQLVNESLHNAGFDLNNTLFYNAVQCQPPKDDDIGIKPIRCCRKNVDWLLTRHPRKVIIALGNEAWTSLHELSTIGGAQVGCGRITKCERFSTPSHECWSVWAVHPAFVLRSPSWRTEFDQSIARAYRLYKHGEPERPECGIISMPNTLDGLAADLASIGLNSGVDELVIDIETSSRKGKTSSPNYQTDVILGVGVGWKGSIPYGIYIPLNHGDPPESCWIAEDWPIVWDALKRHIFNGRKRLIAHNGKFDARHLIHQLGFDVEIAFDTMIAHRMIDENKPHGLKFLARHWLNAPDWDPWDALPDGHHLGMLPLAEVAEYCAYDCVYTLMLKEVFEQQLAGQPYEKTFYHLDTPLFNELTQVELRGLRVDPDTLDQVDVALQEAIQEAEQDVDRESGWAGKVLPHKEKRLKDGSLSKTCQIGVNPRSGKDVGFVLFDHFELEPPPPGDKYWTKANDPRTNEETMEVVMRGTPASSPAWPFLEVMDRARSLSSIYGNVVGGTNSVKANIYPDGMVHTNFGFNPKTDDLKSPVTGRLSSNSPNMQNQKKEIRPIFIAEPGHVLIEADYAQLEVRVWAYHSQDIQLIEAIKSGDFHTMSAAAAFNKAPEDVTTEERDAAKVIVFGGAMYGGDEFVVRRVLKCSEARAREVLDSMYARFSVGKAWLDAQVAHAHEHGWVETMFKRRRRLPEIHSENSYIVGMAERQARNSPIQGGAAELTNLALLRVAKSVKEYGAAVVNTVHDSIIVSTPEEVGEEVMAVVVEEMSRPPFSGFNIPLEVEATVGRRWGGELNVEEIKAIGKPKEQEKKEGDDGDGHDRGAAG